MLLRFDKNQKERFNVDLSKEVSRKTFNFVLGAVIVWGLLLNILLCKTCGDFVNGVNIGLLIGMYIILTIFGLFISYKSDVPIISFIGFNLVCLPLGLLLTRLVKYYEQGSSDIVYMAIVYTGIITAIMVLLSIIFSEWFLSLDSVLIISLAITVIVGIISNIIVGDLLIVSIISAGIFSLYIGYDIQKSQQYPSTIDNAVDCAIDLYIDIINLFLRILDIIDYFTDD